mgnify:CR=1 FL=1
MILRALVILMLVIVVTGDVAAAAVPSVQVWQRDVGVTSVFLVTDEAIYVSTQREGFLALDPLDGEVLWTFHPLASVIGATVAPDGDVYVASLDGTIYALEGSSGWLIWQATIGAVPASGPVLAGKTVVISTYGMTLKALERDTGQLRWQKALPVRSNLAGIRGSEGLVILATDDGELWGIDPQSGGEVWHRRLGAPVTSLIQGAEGRILALTGSGPAAVEAKSGTLAWTGAFAGVRTGVQDVAGERTFLGGTSGVASFALASGRAEWVRELGNTSNGGGHWAPVVYGQLLLAVPTGSARARNYLWILDREGEVLGRYRLPWRLDFEPRTAQELLITAGRDGVIRAFAPLRIFVNGREVSFTGAQPYTDLNRAYAPLRELAQSLGCQVTWDASRKTAIVRRGDLVLHIPAWERWVTAPEGMVSLQGRAALFSDYMLVPVRGFVEILGGQVNWNGRAGRVEILMRAEGHGGG